MPVVSIGMPIYNRPEYLERAIESLLAQTFTDFEILISDNASPNPRIEEICVRYAQRDSRVRYVRQSNNIGTYENFGYVYEHTNAPYFMWAADDDLWEPNFIKFGVTALDADTSKSSWVCQFDSIDSHDKVTGVYHPVVKWESRKGRLRQILWFLMGSHYGSHYLLYSFFRRAAISEPVKLMRENQHIDGADYIFVYAFICRHDLTTNPSVLFHKRGYPRPPQRAKRRRWGHLERHFAGYSRAAAGTRYAIITRLILPWRIFWRLLERLGRFFTKGRKR